MMTFWTRNRDGHVLSTAGRVGLGMRREPIEAVLKGMKIDEGANRRHGD